jgi:hypothetical protein
MAYVLKVNMLSISPMGLLGNSLLIQKKKKNGIVGQLFQRVAPL